MQKIHCVKTQMIKVDAIEYTVVASEIIEDESNSVTGYILPPPNQKVGQTGGGGSGHSSGSGNSSGNSSAISVNN